jgi:hypothetical protein
MFPPYSLEIPDMSRKDVWFLGLFAMAYLYLDKLPGAAPEVERRPVGTAPPRRSVALVKLTPHAACPRDLGHPINLRADGALWCHSCDEAFYPHVALWESVMRVPVAAA